MATSYTTSLKLALPTQGELTGTWGDTVNSQVTSMIEEAVAGLKTINTWSSNSATLSTADGSTSEARAAILNLTDTGTSLSGAATVICPAVSKVYLVKNGTAQTVTVKTASGTGIAIPTGLTALVYCDGTNVLEGLTSVAGNLAVGGNLTVTGTTTFNGGTVTLGDANTDNIVFGGEVDSNIIPDDDGAYDLGSSSKEWKDIYIDGVAYLDEINFNGTAISATAAELNIMDGVTATTSELNILDGVTSTAAELNILDGVTATTAELNIMDGVTSTTAELNILDGVTSTAGEINLLDGSNKSTSSITIADADAFIVIDGNTTKQIPASDIPTYVGSGLTSVGALDSGSITSGFGNIDIGSSTITTTGLITGGSLDIDDVVINGSTIGHTDDTDLITLANGVVTVAGEISVTTLDIGGSNITATASELNIMDGVTATTSELNIMDGVTATTSELNILDGVTATASELNILDGVTSTATELNLVDGSSAGTIVNSKAVVYGSSGEVNATTLQIAGTAITSTASELNILDGVTATASELNIMDGVTATTAELNILDGVTATASELNILDGVTSTAAELNLVDGITAGTVSASKAVIADSNKDVSGFRNVGMTGTLTVSGDAITMNTNTAGKILIADGTDFNPRAMGDLTELGAVADDDVFLVVDTSDSNTLKRIERSAIVSGLATSSGIASVAADSSPQLGGDLDMNGQDIITTSNANIDLAPNGTGKVVVKGNTNPGTVVFNCEANSHGQTVKSQPHTANVTNELTLPAGGDQEIVGTTATQTLENKTLTTPIIAEIDASSNFTLDAGGNIEINADGGTITFKDGASSLGTITSSGYSGTAAVATTVTVSDSNANTNFPVVFHDESNALLDDTGALRYNPSTGTLLVPNLSVAGTTTTVDTVTMQAQNAIIFEGATADANETTLTIVDPTADRTINLPNVSGTIPVLAAVSTTQISATPEELNIMDGVTATTSELNIMDGVTATTSELNIMDGVTATTSELNIMDGVTATTAELNILDGVTASAADINLIDGITNGTVIASKAIITDSNKDISGGRNITISGELDANSLDIEGNADINGKLETDELSINGTDVTATAAELNILDGVTSTTAELNILDGVTATASELNIMDGVTATTAELNIMDGVTATTAELNILDGATVVVGEINALDLGSTAVGTAIASKAVILDSNKDYTGIRNFTITGELDADSLDIEGDADINGTLEADAITVGGTALNTVIAGVTVTDATNAAHVLVTDNESTNENNLITFVENATSSTGNVGLEMDGNLTYNPSTGRLTATQLAGTLQTAAQANITSLGTLTTLTVDNVIVNGTTIGHTDDTDLITLADGVVTVAGEISVTTLDIGGTNVTSTAAELNILDGVTATASELNIMDGVTATTAELNIMDGVTSTTAELNILDGVTSTASELNLVDGITAGTVSASKAVIADSNKDVTGFRNVTTTGDVTVGDDASVAGRATGNQETDNDGNFDLATANFFKCTPSGNFTLTLSNPAEGQSGTIMLINTGGHTVSAHASIAINADILTAISSAGTYMLSYYCSAASGNDTILVGATGALT